MGVVNIRYGFDIDNGSNKSGRCTTTSGSIW